MHLASCGLLAECVAHHASVSLVGECTEHLPDNAAQLMSGPCLSCLVQELMEDALDGITAAVPRGPVSLAINTSVAHTSGSSAVSSPKPYINNR